MKRTMSESERVIVKGPTEGRTIGIVGDIYRFLATSEETGGRYSMFEATVLPGGGPPPHIHRREDETFYVLEGEITFQIGDERRVAKSGTFVHMPIGNLHAFKNETSQPAKMLISLAPAGLEEMFFEVGKNLGKGETPDEPSLAEIEELLKAAGRYGIEYKLPAP
jgi:quercetin dioxygenase-like cupin family protein